MPEPLTELVTLRIVPEEGEPKPRSWKRREKRPDPEEEPKRGLPPYVLLTKDGRLASRPWPGPRISRSWMADV